MRKDSESGQGEFVTNAEVKRIAESIKAVRSMECSALTQEGLSEVGKVIVETALGKILAQQNSDRTTHFIS